MNASNNANAMSLTLDARTLAPFHDAWRRAIAARRDDAPGVIDDARRRFATIAANEAPEFVRHRLQLVPDLIGLVSDHDWDAPAQVRQELLGALAYLSDPSDLIPDDQPRYGLLDDALVLEMAVNAHRDEWHAWLDFQRLREQLGDADGERLTRDAWYSLRRAERRDARRANGTRFGYAATAASLHRERASYLHPARDPERFDVH